MYSDNQERVNLLYIENKYYNNLNQSINSFIQSLSFRQLSYSNIYFYYLPEILKKRNKESIGIFKDGKVSVKFELSHLNQLYQALNDKFQVGEIEKSLLIIENIEGDVRVDKIFNLNEKSTFEEQFKHYLKCVQDNRKTERIFLKTKTGGNSWFWMSCYKPDLFGYNIDDNKDCSTGDFRRNVLYKLSKMNEDENLRFINNLIEEQLGLPVRLSRLIVEQSNQITLPEYDWIVELPPLEKVLYLLVLKNNKEILIDNFNSYRESLFEIYRLTAAPINSDAEKELISLFEDKSFLLDKLRAIKSYFMQNLYADSIAQHYYIFVDDNVRMSIGLDRSFVNIASELRAIKIKEI